MKRSRNGAPCDGRSGCGAAFARAAVGLAMFSMAVGGMACRKSATPADAAAAARSVQHYTVRGEVVALPQPGRAGSELAIRHEPIEDFVDQSGKVVGMDSMVMPFVVEPSISLAGISVGDKVRLQFAVDWSRPAFWIERLEKLPDDTELHFGPAEPRGY